MTEQNIYEIPGPNFDTLQTKINKLNKKAVKLNCQPITLTKVGCIDKKIKSDDFGFDNYMRYYQITISGTAPIIAGWELIASCEIKENGTLIKSIPDKTYPEHYRTKLICEHCKSDRYRKYTFIVRNIETNEYKMIGKSCLKDFLGHVDPNLYAQILQYLTDPDLSQYNDNELPSSDRRINTEDYLCFVSACIREKGWVSRTAAKESEREKQATADFAIEAMKNIIKPLRDRYGNLIHFPIPDEKDNEIAKSAINWAKDLNKTNHALNDYLYNINLLSYETSIKYSDLGFVASIVSSYIRYIEKQILKEKQQTAQKEKQISDYIGKPGDKIQKELTYINTYSFESMYGVTHIHKFIDSEGNILVWKTANDIKEQHGSTIKIKGTIKEHNEYRDEKQTILTRCKLIS